LVRAEQFMASVKVTHFPVREVGGIAWVWLGAAEGPAFPDLPFAEEHGVNTNVTVSVLPCNWLQGLEGGLDSVHGPILHQAWLGDAIKRQSGTRGTAGAELALASTPVYETMPTPYGMRTASLRPAGDDGRFVRVAHFFLPLVVVVPIGFADHTQIFAFAPIDDTHHLLFFGNYGQVPQSSQRDFGALRDGVQPDPRNFASVVGDRSNRWGQDRELMRAGHFTGIDRSVIDEDAVVQTSMGAIADRPNENLSQTDGAVAQARRLLLDALASAAAGQPPPGSALGAEVPRIPHPFEAVIDAGVSWRDLQNMS
jgi:phthalate 4,5-dioxygenase